MNRKQFCSHRVEWGLQNTTEIGLVMVVVESNRAITHKSLLIIFQKYLKASMMSSIIFVFDSL